MEKELVLLEAPFKHLIHRPDPCPCDEEGVSHSDLYRFFHSHALLCYWYCANNVLHSHRRKILNTSCSSEVEHFCPKCAPYQLMGLLSYIYYSAFPLHYFSFNFGPILTKFGVKVGHGTLTTGKILRSGYLGNCCHGNEKMFLILKYSLDWPKNVPGRSMMDGSKIMV